MKGKIKMYRSFVRWLNRLSWWAIVFAAVYFGAHLFAALIRDAAKGG